MSKATKAQVKERYDTFMWILRDFQGGTTSEQARPGAAQATLARLQAEADKLGVLMLNPSAAVIKDKWLTEAATVTVPERLLTFRARWAMHSTPENVIPFLKA